MNKLSIQSAIRELENVVAEITTESSAGIRDNVPGFGGRFNYLRNLKAMLLDTITNLKREL